MSGAGWPVAPEQLPRFPLLLPLLLLMLPLRRLQVPVCEFSPGDRGTSRAPSTQLCKGATAAEGN